MRKIVITAVAVLIAISSFCQTPNGFNYQLVLRNSSGDLISNQSVDIEISIIDDNSGGPVLYTETHTKTTNSYGLVNLIIGSEIPDFGVFSDINWAVNDKFIQVKVDATDMGTFQLLSVPFAMHAGSATNLGSENVYTGTDTLFVVKDVEGNPVFVVFPEGVKVIVDEVAKGRVGGFAVSGRSPTKADETEIFLATPDSTRIFVNDTLQSKGRVGGFAVSGRSPTKSIKSDYLLVTQDSTRIYVNDTTIGKGRAGGFAVSGRSPTKSGIQDYFNISGSQSADTVNNEPRVMWYPKKAALLAGEVHVGSADSVGENSTALGYRTIAMGERSQAFGFKSKALGNYSTAIGKNAIASSDNSFAFGDSAVALNIDSYAIGGGAMATGTGSYAFGSVERDTLTFAQRSNFTEASGDYSFAIGMGSRAIGNGSTSIGLGAFSSGKNSIAMGTLAEATGDYSVAIGLENKSPGYASVALGKRNNANGYISFAAGAANTASGPYSAVFGYTSLASGKYSFAAGEGSKAQGQSSVALGYFNTATNYYGFAAGMRSNAGYGGVALGVDVEANDYNIALGHAITATTGYYSVAIGLGTSNATLTQGSTMAIMGGNVGIGTVTPSYTLEVNGSAAKPGGGTWTNSSDKRLKDIHGDYTKGLNEIIQLNPIVFNYKKDNARNLPSDEEYVGFIAQEVKIVFPESVNKGADGYLDFNMHAINVAMVNAIKEQDQKIAKLETENEELKSRLAEIEKLLLAK